MFFLFFREGFWMWLVGLCASVGGVVATSNIAAIIIKWIVHTVCCAYGSGGETKDGSKTAGGAALIKDSLNTVKSDINGR